MDMQDKIIEKLVEMKERIESLVTKVDFQIFEHRVTQLLNDRSVILERLDQERFFTSEHIRRIEADVEMPKRHLHLV